MINIKTCFLCSILFIAVQVGIWLPSQVFSPVFLSLFSKCKDAIFFFPVTETCIYIHIHMHVFRPAQDSSVWLGSTSREQLMSPECSKHQVLSFAKMLLVNEQKKKFYSHQCSPECSMNKLYWYINFTYIFIYMYT